MGTAIMVTSGKGGTGKTSFVAGVGGCLAGLGKRVLCIDMDVGLRNLDLSLHLSDRAVMDFTDVLRGSCTLGEAAVEHPDIAGLYLLTAPVDLTQTDREQFRRLVEDAKGRFDLVLLDSPSGLGEGFQLASCGADRAVVVASSDPAALRDAQRTVSELIRNVPQLHLVMNRVAPREIRRLHTSIDQAMDAAGLPLLGVVPEDPRVRLAAGNGKPLVLCAYKGAVRAYLNIAKRLLGEKVPLSLR